jgi:hypothetical protein
MTRKYDEMIQAAIEELKNNDDLFIGCVDELDNWNGFADGFRAYDMSEIDEFYCDCKASKLLEDMTGDFNKYDNYFYFSIYGLESTDDKVDLYRSNVDEGELLDNLIDKYNHLDINWIDSDFDELLDEIVNYEEVEEA